MEHLNRVVKLQSKDLVLIKRKKQSQGLESAWVHSELIWSECDKNTINIRKHTIASTDKI